MSKAKPYQVPADIAIRAEREARRQRTRTGDNVIWTQVVADCLRKHLPK